MTAITRPGGPIESDEIHVQRLPLWVAALVFVAGMAGAIGFFG